MASLTAPIAAPLIENDADLLKRGIVRVQVFTPPAGCHSLLPSLNLESIKEASPFNQSLEDDEYAFYKNLLDDVSSLPLQSILDACSPPLLRHFVGSMDEIRLDDAFCVSYNPGQHDSRCAKHQDPSDITVNVNLERTPDMKGSQIMFYGAKNLRGVPAGGGDAVPSSGPSSRFLVDTKLGWCTIHYGSHPHETTALEGGERTNLVLTFVYKDESKSEANRTCYAFDQREEGS
mmetsp:Transcript_15911/g.32488  ORF Transcript_15911/g.32488 Transcript_15911/m.32488 type:complete len:233 (+) Transcript_15911:47-745(+)|eukprot:CAMPEP_0197570590 /NCGR_PEP_ID=MMETSP1320-20131121/40976_1 /TAXON_ID=91990 /ORGANISM="Bolidomonas sp., Strain RCC2347" /LENGTH=232 /DNA_ID=CAMNT_0043133031 /DNA_START=39 /DNA_END=737 /DNA_ORIENTATION=-